MSLRSAMAHSRASIDQMNALIDFMEKHPIMTVSNTKEFGTRVECKQLWQQAANICNAIPGGKKTTKGWIKFWADKKCNVKKQAAQRGVDDSWSDIDRRIHEFLNNRGGLRSKLVKKRVKREEASDYDDQSNDGDLSDTRESKPIEFIDNGMVDADEERHNAMIEKLFQVMTEQATALTQLAQASQSQATSLQRLADAAERIDHALRISSSRATLDHSLHSQQHLDPILHDQR